MNLFLATKVVFVRKRSFSIFIFLLGKFKRNRKRLRVDPCLLVALFPSYPRTDDQNDLGHRQELLTCSKTCVTRPLATRSKIGFQDELSLNAILSTFIKLPFVIKVFVLSVMICRFTQVFLYLFTLMSNCFGLLFSCFQGRT